MNKIPVYFDDSVEEIYFVSGVGAWSLDYLFSAGKLKSISQEDLSKLQGPFWVDSPTLGNLSYLKTLFTGDKSHN